MKRRRYRHCRLISGELSSTQCDGNWNRPKNPLTAQRQKSATGTHNERAALPTKRGPVKDFRLLRSAAASRASEGHTESHPIVQPEHVKEYWVRAAIAVGGSEFVFAAGERRSLVQ